MQMATHTLNLWQIKSCRVRPASSRWKADTIECNTLNGGTKYSGEGS